jgi:beta-lactamase class D
VPPGPILQGAAGRRVRAAASKLVPGPRKLAPFRHPGCRSHPPPSRLPIPSMRPNPFHSPAIPGSVLLFSFVLLIGCGDALPDGSPASNPEPVTSPQEGEAPLDLGPVLAEIFGAHDARGTLLVRRLADGREWVHDPDRSEKALVPASTFKIANAAIALETRVVSSPDEVFPWDGMEREFAGWNQDHTLGTAMTASAVPVYQEVARRIGSDRMSEWLGRLEYGNGSIGGGIDQFWLTGELATSARDQVDFLERWHEGVLPLSPSTLEAVTAMLRQDGDTTCQLYAKTGWAFEAKLGWWVGWTACPDDSFVFALNLDIRDPSVDPGNRIRIGRAGLEALGALY